MIILLGFLLPLVIFVGLMISQVGRKDLAGAPRSMIGAFLLVAIWTSLAVYFVYSRSGPWKNATEIAWVGVGTNAPGKMLRIGGNDPGARFGWPREGFSPDLQVTPQGNGVALVTIRAGGGLLAIPGADIAGKGNRDDRILGAEVIRPGSPKEVDGRKVFLRETAILRKRTIEIALPELDGVVVSAVEIQALDSLAKVTKGTVGWVMVAEGIKRSPTDTPVILQDRLYRQIAHLRSKGGEFARAAGAVEQWAANVQYYCRDVPPAWWPRWAPIHWFDRVEVYILGRRSMASARVNIPSGVIALMKPGTKVRLRLLPGSNGGVDALFLPPWRVVSPLPPADSRWQLRKDEARLTIAATPRPDEACFILPLAGDLAEIRFNRTLLATSSDAMEFNNQGEENGSSGGRKGASNIPAILGWSGITSTSRLEAGGTSFLLATVTDLPHLWRVLLGLFLALIVPLYGLLRLVPSNPGRWRNGIWMTAGILACTWTMLSLRILLSLRYSLSPAALDGVAVRGVGCAFAVLPMAMAAILVIAGSRFAWRPREGLDESLRKKIFRGLLAMTALAWVLTWFEYYLAVGLWSNIPEYYRILPGNWKWSVFIGMPIGLITWISLSYRGRDDAPMHALHWFEQLCIKIGPNIWDRPGRNGYRIVLSLVKSILLLVVIVVLMAMVFSITSSNSAFLVELLGSAILLTVAALWLGGMSVGERTVSWRPTVILSAVMMATLFIFPFAFRDVGALYAALGIFLPLCIIMIAPKPSRPVGVIANVGLVVGVVLVFATLMNWQVVDPLMKYGPLGEIRTRVLTFKQGEGILSDSVAFPVVKEAEGPSAWKIRNAVQHTWGNKAMVHVGGWLGNGFGKGPAHQLQIREQTLRYDSLFSCYIVAEYGLLGGMALLLISAMPLLITLLGKPVSYRQGFAFGVLLTAAFCMDGVFQAAMNFGLLPFTGRNYPLLSVVSASDFLHWVLVLAIAAQVFFWDDPDAKESPTGLSPRKEGTPYLLLGLGTATMLGILLSGSLLVADPRLEHFDWNRYISKVDDLIRTREIAWDEKLQEIVVRNPVYGPLTTLGQEIGRFNSLPQEEKQGMPDPAMVEEYLAGIGKLRTLEAYDSFLKSLAVVSPVPERSSRPLLFQLVSGAPSFLDDLEGTTRHRSVLATNPGYNNIIVLNKPRTAEDLPTVRLARDGDVRPLYELRVGSFTLNIPTEWKAKGENRIVTFLLRKDGSLSFQKDSNPGIGKGEVHITSARTGKSKMLFRFEAEKEGLRVGQGAPLAVGRGGKEILRIGASKVGTVEHGDVISLAEEDPRAGKIRFGVRVTKGKPLIGPAWVMGQWSLATNNRLDVPWGNAFRQIALHYGSGEGKDSFEQIAGSLTLDPSFHDAAQRFVRTRGRQLFSESLKNAGLPDGMKRLTQEEFRKFLPPRVALAVIDVPEGQVLALGAWPRTRDYSSWVRMKDGEAIPPMEWLEQKAPRSLRSRYLMDHNFDRMLMGSSTKPIWAAGVLALNPELSRLFCVRGGAEVENSVFGIPISGQSSWRVGGSRSVSGSEWCDFDSYLSRSDNRYQIRLGFLGLASSSGGKVLFEDRVSPSTEESMDGGKSPWRRFPKFPDELHFSSRDSQSLANLDQAPLFGKLWEMFRIGYRDNLDSRTRPTRSRLSFWTRDPADDVAPIATASVEATKRNPREKLLGMLGGIAPETVNFALDRPPVFAGDSPGRWTPRQYIALLLGGGNNAWANVDFAGAFASAVTGRPVVPHITAKAEEKAKQPAETKKFEDVSRRLRPGLADVLVHGTAVERQRLPAEARRFMKSLPRVKAYAKTGTLHGPDYEVSRIVVALVKWKDKAETEVERGLLFSVVVEDGKTGVATEWFGDFLLENREVIRRHFAVR